jgi:hypothetical protein
MTSRRRISWLYTRGGESVMIFEVAALHLAIFGPGTERQLQVFANGDELFAFTNRHMNSLVAEGFQFQGFGLDRRSGTERRRTLRSANDRRSSARPLDQ